MTNLGRDDYVATIAPLFLRSRFYDDWDEASFRSELIGYKMAKDQVDMLFKVVESSKSLKIKWEDITYKDVGDVATRIMSDIGVDDRQLVEELVSIIEEASKIIFDDDVPWLGYAPIDPCCGNFCLKVGLSDVKPPEDVIIQKWAVYEENGELSIDLVESISEYGFDNSRIKTLFIPSSIRFVSVSFNDCTDFVRFIVDERNEIYCSDEQGLLYNKDMTELYAIPTGLTSIKVPASVTSVNEYALCSGSRLRHVIVDEDNECFSSDGGPVLYNKDKTDIILAPDTLSSFTIPATLTDPDGLLALYDTSVEVFSVEEGNPVFSSDSEGMLYKDGRPYDFRSDTYCD